MMQSDRCKAIIIAVLFSLALTFSLFPVWSLNAEASQISNANVFNFNSIINSIEITQITDHISFLANTGSRYTGSPGFYVAADYIRNRLENYGFSNVTPDYYHRYNITVPIYESASIEIMNYPEINLNIYAMRPNAIVPVVTPGITGSILYAGDGTLKDLSNLGRSIEDCVIILNFNTQQNWLNTMKFGASAVIFIESDEATYQECLMKNIEAPINFPRFYMPIEDSSILLEMIQKESKPLTVKLKAKTVWKTVEAVNVIGLLEGEKPDQIVMVSAHFDSDSVAPALAPGANQATGIATLLELARLFSETKPEYTILFVAYSGYNQGLMGSRSFVEDFLFGGATGDKTEYLAIGEKIILQMHLFLSTLSDNMITSNTGSFQFGRMRADCLGPFFDGLWFVPLENYVFNLFDAISNQLGKEYHLSSASNLEEGRSAINFADDAHTTFQNAFELGSFPNEIEMFRLAAGAGYSLVTVDNGEAALSPTDTYESINIGNLRNQAELTISITSSLANTKNLKEDYLDRFPEYRRMASTYSGDVKEYNERTGDYDAVPNCLVLIRSARMAIWRFFKHNNDFVVQADDTGRFQTIQHTGALEYWCFKLNETTGNIIYAPDQGIHSQQPIVLDYCTSVYMGYFTVFKASSVVLTDLFDPSRINLLNPPGRITILDAYTQTNVDSFGIFPLTISDSGVSLTTLFVKPDSSVMFLLRKALGTVPIGLFTNSSEKNLRGSGYSFKMGDQYILCNTPLESAKSLRDINQGYIDTVDQFGIIGNLPEKNVDASFYIEEAETALETGQYDKVFVSSLIAWRTALGAYQQLRGTIEDTSSSIIFFGFTMVPFTILFESLVFKSRGKRKVLSIIAVFTGFFLVFSVLHPAFQVATNPLMVVIGISTLIMIAPILGIAFNWFSDFLKEFRKQAKGIHEIELSRWSALLLAFQLGVENMKRRKLRTGLTLFTVICIVLGLVLFVSISSYPVFKPTNLEAETLFEGAYIRQRIWGSAPLGTKIVDVLKYEFSEQAAIIPRAWLYNSGIGGDITEAWFTIEHGDRSFPCYAFMGLTSEETNLDWVNNALISGLWFQPTDVKKIILTDYSADILDVTIGDKVQTLGLNLTVNGILDSSVLDGVIEPDLEEMTPWDASLPNQFNIHALAQDITILPYEQLLEFMLSPIGSPTAVQIASVSVVPYDQSPDTTRAIISWTRQHFNEVHLFAGIGGYSYAYSVAVAYTVFGWEMQMIPMALCMFIIMSILLGAIEERHQEIFTYASVGMSPTQVTFMFLAETSVYALVGSMIGYLVAVATGTFAMIIVPGALPSLNYSGGWVMIPLGLTMAFILLPTLFAMRKASKLVTPSLERLWAIPTKPMGTQWDLPFPIVIPDENEAKAMMRFMKQFLETHTGETEAFSLIDLKVLMDGKVLEFNSRLSPYELGLIQSNRIGVSEDESTNKWVVNLTINKVAGGTKAWIRINRKFIDSIRKQLLLWRTQRPEDREQYFEKGFVNSKEEEQ